MREAEQPLEAGDIPDGMVQLQINEHCIHGDFETGATLIIAN